MLLRYNNLKLNLINDVLKLLACMLCWGKNSLIFIIQRCSTFPQCQSKKESFVAIKFIHCGCMSELQSAVRGFTKISSQFKSRYKEKSGYTLYSTYSI
jgi:hypothetical protein